MKIFHKLNIDNGFKIFGLIMIQIFLNIFCQLNPQAEVMARRMEYIDQSISDTECEKKGNKNRNYLSLEGGHLLLTPDKDIVCGTKEGTILIGADATVFITNIDNKTVVYDLAQTAPNRVFVVVNNSKVPMWPGLVLVLSSQKIVDFEKLDPNCRGIKYYNQRPVKLPDTAICATMADFTISSAMSSIGSLRQLISSENSRDQVIVARLLKGAVIARDYLNM